MLLNDLPDNYHSQAIISVTEALASYEEVYINVNGKDCTRQVFPSNTIDIGFSYITAHIIPKAPCARDENLFFLATDEKLATDWGQQWLEAFTKHWAAFLTSRQRELKKHGLLFVQVPLAENPLLEY